MFLDKIRLAPEQMELKTAMDRFDLGPVISNFEQTGGLRLVRDAVFATDLQISEVMSPRLFSLLNGVRSRLKFEEPVDLFVHADASINASAIYSRDELPHMVGVSSPPATKWPDTSFADGVFRAERLTRFDLLVSLVSCSQSDFQRSHPKDRAASSGNWMRQSLAVNCYRGGADHETTDNETTDNKTKGAELRSQRSKNSKPRNQRTEVSDQRADKRRGDKWDGLSSFPSRN